MADNNMKITDAGTITSMNGTDKVFVNSGDDLKQITLDNAVANSTPVKTLSSNLGTTKYWYCTLLANTITQIKITTKINMFSGIFTIQGTLGSAYGCGFYQGYGEGGGRYHASFLVNGDSFIANSQEDYCFYFENKTPQNAVLTFLEIFGNCIYEKISSNLRS